METKIMFILVITAVIFFLYQAKRKNIENIIVLGGYTVTILLFYFELSWEARADFYETITEPGFGESYTPFASAYLPTLVTFLILANVALFIVWVKQRALPPLLFLVLSALTLIGLLINIAILLQLSGNSESQEPGFMILMPLIYLLVAFGAMGRIVMAEKVLAGTRKYRSPALNSLNVILRKPLFQPFLIFAITIPLFFLITMILVVCGQDSHAITKVFTETTTWGFSTESHPAYLPHMGHYLCTVAACGEPKIVKPLRFGTRHGQRIIVNRQLQIANAFEELISDHMPVFHKWLRGLYDKYGYPLSKKINTSSKSNITYRLMKPLEYLFLLVLYSFCVEPEIKIEKQYTLIIED